MIHSVCGSDFLIEQYFKNTYINVLDGECLCVCVWGGGGGGEVNDWESCAF